MILECLCPKAELAPNCFLNQSEFRWLESWSVGKRGLQFWLVDSPWQHVSP